LKIEFKRSFVKDLERVRDKALRERVKETIEQVERAQALQEMENVKKLRGGERYYRIRIWCSRGSGDPLRASLSSFFQEVTF
jgi:mRNA interferase RelE/StbE